MAEVWHGGVGAALVSVIGLPPAVPLVRTQLGLAPAVRRVRVLQNKSRICTLVKSTVITLHSAFFRGFVFLPEESIFDLRSAELLLVEVDLPESVELVKLEEYL